MHILQGQRRSWIPLIRTQLSHLLTGVAAISNFWLSLRVRYSGIQRTGVIQIHQIIISNNKFHILCSLSSSPCTSTRLNYAVKATDFPACEDNKSWGDTQVEPKREFNLTWVSCVVFPDPVSPMTMTTWLSLTMFSSWEERAGRVLSFNTMVTTQLKVFGRKLTEEAREYLSLFNSQQLGIQFWNVG